MAINPTGGKNYTIPKGKLYFGRYPSGVTVTEDTLSDGLRYLGNTPGFTVTSAAENLDHFSSEGGVRVKDASVQLSLNRTGTISTDNISPENLALAILGDDSVLDVASAASQTYEIDDVSLGRVYQVGADTSRPAGVRQISTVTVKGGIAYADTITQAGNYEVDAERGLVYILEDAVDIVAGDDIRVDYTQDAHTRAQAISGTESIYGELKLVADNPYGQNRDWYFPYVKLAPDGDIALKGEEWQTLNFALEVLEKGTLKGIYIDGMPEA